MTSRMLTDPRGVVLTPYRDNQRRMETHSDLSQRALHGSQEVCVTQAVVPGADVVKLEAEPLDLLKVVVHQEDLREDRPAAAANHLCAVHLQARTRREKS